MKKLFLTSGLVLCMAGQAYASTAINYDNNSYGPSGCNYTYLDTYENSSSLEAIWESNPYTITLNSHTETNEYGSTAASPESLYALYGDAVYLEQAHTNAMSTTANGLTAAPNGALPTGKTYTLTLNTNVTTAGTGGMNAAHTDSQVTAASGTKAASTNAQMSFAGFYSAAQSSKTTTNGTQYIGTDGKITTNGISAGTGTASASMWHAQYTCTTAATYEPALQGYTFTGWYDAANNGNVVNDFCLDSNKTVFAHWTANHYDVIYDPGTHGACGASCASTGTNAGKYVHTNGATYDSNYTAVTQNTTSIIPNTGYNFVGWNTQSGQTTANWTGETPWTHTDAYIVYAAYTAQSFNVTYAPGAHGTGGATYNNGITYDGSYTVLAPGAVSTPVVANPGYEFIGWNDGTADRATGYIYTQYQTVGALTLTAQYSAKTTKVAYNCGNSRATTPVAGTWTTPGTGTWTQVAASGGIWAASDNSGIYAQTATYDSAFTHPTGSSVCSLDGYTFYAWVCVTGTTSATTGGLSNNGLGTGDDANKWKTDAAAVTCTATWTPNHITLNWNKNGADSADIAATACDYDGGIDLPTAPTRQGYTFQGWTVCPTAHGTAGTVQNGVCTNTACESGYHVDSNGACVAN